METKSSLFHNFNFITSGGLQHLLVLPEASPDEILLLNNSNEELSTRSQQSNGNDAISLVNLIIYLFYKKQYLFCNNKN